MTLTDCVKAIVCYAHAYPVVSMSIQRGIAEEGIVYKLHAWRADPPGEIWVEGGGEEDAIRRMHTEIVAEAWAPVPAKVVEK